MWAAWRKFLGAESSKLAPGLGLDRVRRRSFFEAAESFFFFLGVLEVETDVEDIRFRNACSLLLSPTLKESPLVFMALFLRLMSDENAKTRNDASQD